jgi:hypothetical protein
VNWPHLATIFGAYLFGFFAVLAVAELVLSYIGDRGE